MKRRFSKVGEIDGCAIIDDYAHHPVEIRAVLAAARESAEERVIAVMQPHRFTRLHDLMEDFQNAFNNADIVFVTPVYAAGEQPIEGVDSRLWSKACAPTATAWCGPSTISRIFARALRDLAAPGDLIICMGAATSPSGRLRSATA